MRTNVLLRTSSAVTFFVFVFLLAFVGIAAPVAADSLVVRLPPAVGSPKIDAGGRPSFDGAVAGAPGSPALPRTVLTVLLPPDADVRTVRVTIEAPLFAVVPGAWDIPPLPEPAVSASRSRNLPPVRRDPAIYGADRFFPAVAVAGVNAANRRGWRVAEITLQRYQYNPVTRVLRRLTEGNLVVTFARRASEGRVPRASAAAERIRLTLSRKAVNFAEVAPLYSSAAAVSAAARFVIVTTSAIRSASGQIDVFAAAKTAAGFATQVVTESQWGGGTGNVAADNVRRWLQTSDASSPISYVLLIGNPDPWFGDVPMKLCSPRSHAQDGYVEAPTDAYYADLTGNWDLDQDGLYGEFYGDYAPGGAGRSWDVLVGRIPYYGNSADLDSILAKIVRYQNAAPGEIAWRRRALLAMEPSDVSTPGYHLGEAIKDQVIVPRGNWQYHRVYEEDYGLLPPPETTSCTYDNVTWAWLAAPTGAAFWWTHGWSEGAVDIMDLEHVSRLADGVPSFTFQSSCDNSYPEDPWNLGYQLLRNGAINTVGATRVSWYYPGQTDFAGSPTNSGMTLEYARRLIGDGNGPAEALQDLKLDIDPAIAEFWMNDLVFNSFGDPSVGVYTSRNQPSSVTITHPVSGQAYPAGANVTIDVSASDDGTVTRVEFFQGATLIGTDTTSPFSFTWLGVPTGSYTLTAKAYDDAGVSSTSAPVLITVSGNSTLLVVGSTTLTAGDALLKGRLQNQGFSVTVKASSALSTADANGKVLVVVSDTVSPSAVGSKLRTVATPVLCLEPQLFDDLGITGTVNGTDYGSVSGQTRVNLTNPSHHMAGGQTGTVTVAASSAFNWGKPGPQAVRVATIVGQPSRWAIFGYERGAAMPGLAAPARRTGWFAGDAGAAALNSVGKELFDSAARWTSGRVGL
jgi:hypothetical protein